MTEATVTVTEFARRYRVSERSVRDLISRSESFRGEVASDGNLGAEAWITALTDASPKMALAILTVELGAGLAELLRMLWHARVIMRSRFIPVDELIDGMQCLVDHRDFVAEKRRQAEIDRERQRQHAAAIADIRHPLMSPDTLAALRRWAAAAEKRASEEEARAREQNVVVLPIGRRRHGS